MFTLRFKDVMPSSIYDEFQSLVDQLKGFLSISFNEDGTLIGSNPLLNIVPIGAILEWGTATAPSGWLLLDGSQKNRVTYKALFELWGTTYGAGDGSTTFNLQDRRGRFPLGKAAAGTGATLGETGGTIDHVHTVSGLTLSGSTGSTTPTISGSTGGNTATATNESGFNDVNVDDNNDGVRRTVAAGPHTHPVSSHDHPVGTLAVSSHLHGVGTLAISGGSVGTANPPYFAINYIVFAGV